MSIKAGQNILAGIDFATGLTEQQAEQIYEQGREAVVFALLQLAQMASKAKMPNLPVAIAADPSTPSAQKPVFARPSSKSTRRKRPGCKKGHKGSRRKLPARIDRTVEHRASCCPDCGGKLKKCSRKRNRCIEDIPEDVQIETVCHVIHRDFCPNCRKAVEPVITEALPCLP